MTSITDYLRKSLSECSGEGFAVAIVQGSRICCLYTVPVADVLKSLSSPGSTIRQNLNDGADAREPLFNLARKIASGDFASITPVASSISAIFYGWVEHRRASSQSEGVFPNAGVIDLSNLEFRELYIPLT